ncbi:hypothetical protein OS493_014706 [Desmophyllum pertusum]|uniref:Alcohol dehydrogenase-like C-terminal domain-containing protein n=1 Tax=Desmophyllum pertusum TaxID=174260 RepID=A0A9W9YG91_9CNID|nr:hypothetical protein OS493_014706 [Desmophyllum pertusum]
MLHDLRHICQNLNQFGHGREQFMESLLLEPFGVAHQAMEELSPSGDTILVQGCGAIGLIAVGIAKCMGAVKIIATDIVEERLQKAKQMGADVLNAQGSAISEQLLLFTKKGWKDCPCWSFLSNPFM